MLGSKYSACCLKADRKDRFILDAHKEVRNEHFEISKLFKKLNVMEGVLKQSLTKLEWQEAKLQYSLIHFKAEREQKLKPMKSAKSDETFVMRQHSNHKSVNN